MNTELKNKEKIIKSGSANLQKGIETVGGKIYLTNERIIFESHNFNIQSGKNEINLTEITRIEYCWTKFLGFIPIIPNSLSIITNKGKYNFVIAGRSAWKSKIDELLNK